MFQKFIRNTSGATATIFSVAAIGLLAVTGLAVDYSVWQAERTKLQQMADSASLKAMSLLNEGIAEGKVRQATKDHIDAYFPALPNSQLASFTIKNDKTEATIVLTKPAARSLTKVIFPKDLTISVTSTARTGAKKSGPMCVLALEPIEREGFSLTGGSIAELDNCTLQVNSSAYKAALVSGGGSINAKENCIVGTAVTSGGSTITPQPVANCDPVSNPFAAFPALPVGSCNYTNGVYSGNITLSPGVYCGGLELDAGATVHFNPGIYIIKDGTFKTKGGGVYTGTGVSFYLTGTDAGIEWTGGGKFDLKAPTNGPLSGILVFLDNKATPSKRSVISGGGDVSYEGILYFGNQDIEMTGGSDTLNPAPFTMFIAKTILYSGGGSIRLRYNPNAATVPIRSEVFKSSAGGISLVR